MDIVDVTNLIMTELGQPMHAFDADKVVGTISVRLARPDEKIIALNGVEYTLTPDDLVIADSHGPIAIAGVIGGLETAVSESTTNIIWESGCFDPTSVRLTAQRHGIRTDASTRYEKSLDPLLASTVFPRVEEYLHFLGKKYTITGHSTYVDHTQVKNISIEVSYTFIDTKAGVTIPKESVIEILTRLGFRVSAKDDSLTVHVPSWRSTKDVSIKEDIAEEVARVYGYENVPYTSLNSLFSIGKKNEEITLRNLTQIHFSKLGWHEVYNYSFTSKILDEKIGYTDMENAIGIQNAFNEEYTHMIRSLAPRLFLDVSHNQKYSDQFAFFEIGKVYHK
jgi:phenylalanyl-tRNA synthetase beta chain